MNNQIESNLTVEEFANVRASVQSIREGLPFLQGVSAQERLRLYKLGDKSLMFVQRALEASRLNANMLPRQFSVEDFENSLDLFLQLKALHQDLLSLSELVLDTKILVGSELQQISLSVYNSVKRLGKGEGMEEIGELLSQRFQRTINSGDSGE